MLKLAGVVILYHPDVAKTLENMASYANQLDKLYILDNSEPACFAGTDAFAHLNVPIEYIATGVNEGISKRLNQAAHKAIQEGFDFLLTMDQDSCFETGAFVKFKTLVKDHLVIAEEKGQKIAQFGVNSDPQHIKISEQPLWTNNLITSGTILNLSIFQRVGNFDENLFIDFVDVEYSLRADYLGYQNIIFPNVVMQHSLGFIKMGRSFKTFKKTPRILHAPIRVYYIVRNGWYLLFKVKQIHKEERKAILLNHMKLLKNDFLYNDELAKVYGYALLGTFHFFINKMGKK
jgi:rhamnosyltransferase